MVFCSLEVAFVQRSGLMTGSISTPETWVILGVSYVYLSSVTMYAANFWLFVFVIIHTSWFRLST